MGFNHQPGNIRRQIADYSGVAHEWKRCSSSLGVADEDKIARLVELANKNKWSSSGFDWQAINLSSIPQHLRQGAADMFAQLLYGEVTALTGAAILLQTHHSYAVQEFLRVQLDEESRHVEWFAHVLDKLDCQGQVSESVLNLADAILDCGSVEELVLGLHILIEGMAHSMFMEGARAFSHANKFAMFVRPFRMARKVVAEWMPEYLGKDESRHIAFGTCYLKQRISQLSLTQRTRLEMRVESWAQLYQQAAYDPQVWPVNGLDGTAIANRCVDVINHRLKIIGLDSRLEQKQETGAHA